MEKMSLYSGAKTDTIELDRNKYYKLLAAQIVLDTYKNSIDILKQTAIKSDQAKLSEQTDNLNGLDTFDSHKPKNRKTSDANEYVTSRKFINQKRWHCISRPQYKFSCGISSVVSCWNYLYSTLGYGSLKPLTQEQALDILGFREPFDSIRFGPFTGNATLMRWFRELNNHFGVYGEASFLYKPVGRNKTFGMTGDIAKSRLKTLLKSKDSAFIYHCHNHYMSPIGFEEEPVNHSDVFDKNSECPEYLDWIIIGDTSRKYQQLHCIKWEDINIDLSLKYPDYLNVRRLDKGIQQNGYKKSVEKNLHCLIHFKRLASDPLICVDQRLVVAVTEGGGEESLDRDNLEDLL